MLGRWCKRVGKPLGSLVALLTLTVSALESPRQITSVEGITEYRLANGLQVILFPDPSKPTITVNMTYLVGSRHEAYGETGMAHLLEHLVFKGTPRHPNIPQELTERGASPNGTTSSDRTNYFETLPATDENLEWALDLESDRMINSFISAEDLESEMTVVRNEMESGENNPFRILYQRTMSMAYLWHNYGKSTIGARSDVEAVPIDRLKAFYRKYYQPDNAVLILAGKFEPKFALEKIVEKFGVIPAPDRSGENQIYPTYTRDPIQDGERSVTLRRVGDVQYAMVIHHIPPGAHEDLAALDILSHVLDNATSGRLHEALVDSNKAVSVASYAYQFRESGPMLTFAQVRKDGSLDDVWETMQDVIYGTANEDLVTDSEVERARAFFLKNIELGFNSSQNIALQLSNWVAMGDWRLFFLHRDRLAAVTTENVRRVAATYLKPQNSTVGFFIPTDNPDRVEIPDVPDMAVMLAGFKGREAVKSGESFDTSLSNIESRTQKTTFDNGFKLAMLPKETRGANVVVSLALLFGSEPMLRNKATRGEFAGSMLMRGTERLDRQQLIDELNRLKARGGVGGGVYSASGSLQTTRENLPAVIELVGEIVKTPAFDPDQFSELKQTTLAGYEVNRSDPRALGALALTRLLNPLDKDHPLYVSSFDEAIASTEEVKLDEVVDFHASLYGASNGRMAIVGDFDPAEIAPLVGTVFGNWQSPIPFERVANPFKDVSREKIVINTVDKPNAYFAAGLGLPIGDDHADYPALVLANFMLGGGFLSSRLATRLRQNEGLSYGVASRFSAHPIDQSGLFRAYAIYAPHNANKLETAFMEEIERAVNDGFTDDEVSDAKLGYVQYRNNMRSNDTTLASILSQNLYLDRTMAWTENLEKKIVGLTPDDIQAALQRHIIPERISVVIAGDFDE